MQTFLQKVFQVEDLLQPVAELQEAVRRLHNIREAENKLVGSAVGPQPNSQKFPQWHMQK